MTSSRFGKVAVLGGGVSGEREVSLASSSAICAALQSEGVNAQFVDPSDTPLTELGALGFDVVFNALHGGAGEDGTVQGALTTLGLPFTGSGVLGSALAMDKVRSKAVLRDAGIDVPRGVHVSRGDPRPTGLTFPVFVKPASGGSSLGSMPVDKVDGLQTALDAALQFDDVVLVETQLMGAEYTIGIVDGEALPVIHIEAANTFYDYNAKYESEQTRFTCPALIDDAAFADRLAAMALTSFDALGCAGWGRVDFMCDADGKPYVLEVNTVPGMTDHSLVPCAGAAAGISFPKLCMRILALAQPVTKEQRT
ncbi:MAG: D-alanine--D-alanine ligase [Pseudomonadota bacterium]